MFAYPGSRVESSVPQIMEQDLSGSGHGVIKLGMSKMGWNTFSKNQINKGSL